MHINKVASFKSSDLKDLDKQVSSFLQSSDFTLEDIRFESISFQTSTGMDYGVQHIAHVLYHD